MNKNNILIDEKELESRFVCEIKDLFIEQTPLSDVFYNYLYDILSKVVTNYVLTEKIYDFYDEFSYGCDIDISAEDMIENNEVVIERGNFSPLEFDYLSEFLDTSSSKFTTSYNWGRQELLKIPIMGEIYERFDKMLKEEKENIKKQIINDYFKIENKEECFVSKTIVKKERTLKNKKTGEIKVNIVEKVIKNKEKIDIESLNVEELIETVLENEGLVNSFMEEVDFCSFSDIYKRGCFLLGVEDTFYKYIKYNNSETEKLLFDTLNEIVENKSYTDFKGGYLNNNKYSYAQNNNFDFKEELSVLNGDRDIGKVQGYIRHYILQDSFTLKEKENALKLLSATYIYNHDITLDKLKEIIKIDFVKNCLFDYNLSFIVEHIYPKYIQNIGIRKIFNLEPKSDYPKARTMRRHFILHIGGTNSGKTYESLQRFKECETGVYLAPLRLLALEVQSKMIQEGIKCDLLTGEEEDKIINSTHICSTIEKLDYSKKYDIAIIDEAQMIENLQRGSAWTGAILGVCAREVHVCLSSYAKDIIIELIKYCNDTYEEVYHNRDTELIVEQKNFNFLKDIQKGDALIAFSKRKVLNLASKINKETDMKCSVLFGALPYKSRKKQFEDFASGKTQVLITTDAIGLGVNLAIKRVVFMEDEKFNGIEVEKLKTTELLQIGGRAGRKNIYDKGYVIMKNNKMLNKFHSEIEPLKNIYVGLTERILEANIELEEALLEWRKMKLKTPFMKADISTQLTILSNIKKIPLRKSDTFKALFLPVNVSSEYEIKLLKKYLRTIAKNQIDIKFPSMPPLEYDDRLKQYEMYSKGIDLYYSFGKTYNLPIDIEKVNLERENISNKINQLLLNSKLEISTCNECNRELPWNYNRYTCEKCLNERYDYYYL